MMGSVWAGETGLPRFDSLKGDKKTDVLIIGGGMCGILCAYFLQQAGIDYILAEGSTVASGATKNTTAKLTVQHGLICSKLIRTVGIEKAEMYLGANLEALSKYKELCGGECSFEEKSSYVYSLYGRDKLEAEVRAAERLGLKAELRENVPLPFKVKGAVELPGQAQFNPLEFIARISKGLNIYENTFISEIGPGIALYNGGKITAGKIIAATHFPFLNKHGSYFLKLYQSRSYVTAFENAPEVDGMYISDGGNGISLRNYKGLLLVGGGGHRTGHKGGGWQTTLDFAKSFCPGAKPKYQWAAQDCMSLDGIPYIGSYSARTPDLYVATGFNKWGMTSSMAAAMILADLAAGRENPYAPVFSPQRSILRPQLFLNAAEAVFNLVMPTTKRCPHMGCALKWNKEERSWDCPCHGSRFTENGVLIDNPATADAKLAAGNMGK